MTEVVTKQSNGYLARLLRHGEREGVGSVRGRLKRKDAEIARLRRCLSYRADGSALLEAASQAATAYLLVDRQHKLLQKMWKMFYPSHASSLQRLVPDVLALAASTTGNNLLKERDKARDLELLSEVKEMLSSGVAIQDLIERRLNDDWVPKAQ